MLRQIRALTWEYFGECWHHLAGMFALIIGGPVFFHWVTAGVLETSLYSPDDEPMRFYIQYIACLPLFLTWPHYEAVINTASRNRVLPVSSNHLATFLFLTPVVTAMLSNVVIQHTYWLALGVPWPISTTTILAGVATALLSAGLWWARNFRAYKFPVLFVVAVAWGFYALDFFVCADMSGPFHTWGMQSVPATPPLHSFLVIAGIVVASWRVTVSTFARYRAGELRQTWIYSEFMGAESGVIPAVLDAASSQHRRRPKPGTPAQALAALNRDVFRSWLVLLCIAVGCITVAGCLFYVAAVQYGPPDGRNHTLAIVGSFMPLVSGGMGCFLGAQAWVTKTGAIPSFVSTLPVSDRDFGRTLLWNWTKSAAIGWGTILLGGATIVALHAAAVGMEQLQLEYADIYSKAGQLGHFIVVFPLVGTALICWTCTTIMGTLTSLGRPKLVAAIVITVCLLSIASAIPFVLTQMGFSWAPQAFDTLVFVAIVAVLGVGTIATFILAHQRKLISNFQTFTSAALVATLSCLLLKYSPESLPSIIIACCFTCLIVAPIAATPCAIQHNRHQPGRPGSRGRGSAAGH